MREKSVTAGEFGGEGAARGITTADGQEAFGVVRTEGVSPCQGRAAVRRCLFVGFL